MDSKQALIPFYVGLSYRSVHTCSLNMKYCLVTIAFRELGDAKQAGDYHSLAIRLNPMSPDMHYGRGQFLYSSGHHAEALEDFGVCSCSEYRRLYPSICLSIELENLAMRIDDLTQQNFNF